MLSRSNFSIRRLISPRRTRDVGEEEGSYFLDHDEGRGLKGTPKHQKSWSWMPPKQLAKKFPKPIIIVRASEDIHRIRNLPPLPDTPYSSKSSLCSCEYHNAGQASPPRPGSRSPALCSISSKTDLERRPRLSAKTLHEDGRVSPQSLWTVGDEKHISMPMAAEPNLNPPEETILLHHGAELGLGPPAPRPGSAKVQQKGPEECLDNVQNLIRETEEAFGLVGISVSQPRPGPSPFKSDRKPDPEQLIRPLALQPSSSRNLRRINTSNLRSPTRSGSISKPKRERSQNSRRRPPKRIPKWTDNAKELFNIRLFNRIEADEMLPPSRLEEIRLSRSSQLRPKKSTETMRTFETDGSETPSEPFHLQDLPSRIGAAGVSLSVPSPIEEVRTPRLFDLISEVVPKDLPSETKDIPVNEEDARVQNPQPIPEDVVASKESPVPAPPPKNPLRFLARMQLPPLPAIPEVMISTPENNLFSPSSDPSAATKSDAFVFLPCRPYTLTMPTFRHGTIRLAKADLAIAYSSTKLAAVAVDETLDWTAFQMAILGGAGDFFGESTDYSRRSDAEADEVDDLCDWFDSFGFEGHGRLISTERPISTPSPTISTPVTSRASDQSLPIPVEHEHPDGFWNQGTFDAGRFYNAQSFGVRRWAVEGHPKRYEKSLSTAGSRAGRRTSMDSVLSLPQSPMPDLGGGHEGSEAAVEVVPMGYNLGHDLGDFLKWETEHVCAPGFYGSEESGNDI